MQSFVPVLSLVDVGSWGKVSLVFRRRGCVGGPSLGVREHRHPDSGRAPGLSKAPAGLITQRSQGFLKNPGIQRTGAELSSLSHYLL